MDMAHTVKTPLRRSFSEHVKDSTNKAWDIFWRSAREKRLSEIEANEACDWLRAAGFPQYTQLFKDCCFPVDIDWVRSDHEFLDSDALETLCRRLGTLNKYMKMKMDLSSFKRCGRNDEDLESYAISPKWSYDHKTRHWIRTDDLEFLPSVDSSFQGQKTKTSHEAFLSDSSEHHKILSTHSSSSADSDGGSCTNKITEDPETNQSFSRCSSTCKTQANEERSLKKGQSLLHKMEKLRLQQRTLWPKDQGGKARLVINSPVLQVRRGEEKQDVFCNLNISALQGKDKACRPASCLPQDSSRSPSESSSFGIPSPVSKVRSNCKKQEVQMQVEEHAHVREQVFHNQHNLNVNPNFQIIHDHTFPTILRHNPVFSPIENTSINWRTGSFHGYQGRNCQSSSSKDQKSLCSPLVSHDHQDSIYNNVPDDLQMTDDVFSALDNVMKHINELQDLVTTWTEKLSEDVPSDLSHTSSPSLSSLTDIHLEIKDSGKVEETGPEQNYDKTFKPMCNTIQSTDQHSCTQKLYWCSEQISRSSPTPCIEAQLAPCVTMLQRLSLLRFTALMDKHSPFSKQGWNWSVPKLYRNTKSAEHKSRKVFGVPLLQIVQQTGKPLPPSILKAMEYLKTECLDQVGLFRKSGVKSRIQYLRDMVEADPDGVSFEDQSAFDVADMLKQYFRDLPEPIFCSKLCESFLHIYQYFPKDKQFEAAQAAIFLMPDENREALKSLLFFLSEVVACMEENQMTPTNLAVCLAPSLFHLNVIKRDSISSRSHHRKYSLGKPDQRDLSENLAATQGLANMVADCTYLFQMPHYWEQLNLSLFFDDPLGIEGGFGSSQHNDETAFVNHYRLDLSIQQLIKEAGEKTKGWVASPTFDHVDVTFKKVDDGYPLLLWRGVVEVDAPQKEVLQRVLREHGQWQSDLQHSEVVEIFDKDAEIYQYTLQAAGTRPPLQHLLLRIWQSDPTSGPMFVASSSVEHADWSNRGVTAQVLCCLFLVEPMGSKRSRLTHFCRTDTGGRSVEWHTKVAGHLLASSLVAVRDSFRLKTKDARL